MNSKCLLDQFELAVKHMIKRSQENVEWRITTHTANNLQRFCFSFFICFHKITECLMIANLITVVRL